MSHNEHNEHSEHGTFGLNCLFFIAWPIVSIVALVIFFMLNSSLFVTVYYLMAAIGCIVIYFSTQDTTEETITPNDEPITPTDNRTIEIR